MSDVHDDDFLESGSKWEGMQKDACRGKEFLGKDILNDTVAMLQE